MFSFLSNLFRPPVRPALARLDVESLETRTVPSAAAAPALPRLPRHLAAARALVHRPVGAHHVRLPRRHHAAGATPAAPLPRFGPLPRLVPPPGGPVPPGGGRTATGTNSGAGSAAAVQAFINQVHQYQKQVNDYLASQISAQASNNQIHQSQPPQVGPVTPGGGGTGTGAASGGGGNSGAGPVDDTQDYINQIYQDQQQLNDYLASLG